MEKIFPCQGDALGKSTCQGRKRGNSMTKEVREEKEKVTKISRKEAKDKDRKNLQMTVQLTLRELKKVVRKKEGCF